MTREEQVEMYRVKEAHRDGARCTQCPSSGSIWYCRVWLKWWPRIRGSAMER